MPAWWETTQIQRLRWTEPSLVRASMAFALVDTERSDDAHDLAHLMLGTQDQGIEETDNWAFPGGANNFCRTLARSIASCPLEVFGFCVGW